MTKTLHVFLLTACVLLSTTSLFGVSNIYQEPSTKKAFPREINTSDNGHNYTMELTGVAVRSKYFVNVYALAHYMENPVGGRPNEIYQDIMTDGKAKAAVADWAHSATLKQIKDGYAETFHKTLSPQDYFALQGIIDHFMSFYQTDIRVNDQHVIRWLPGGVLEVYVNGDYKGSVVSVELAQALWSNWFGPKSIIDRQQLISFVGSSKRNSSNSASR